MYIVFDILSYGCRAILLLSMVYALTVLFISPYLFGTHMSQLLRHHDMTTLV